jgi:hypothetical protein
MFFKVFSLFSVLPMIPLFIYSLFNAIASWGRLVPSLLRLEPYRGIALKYAVQFEVLLLPLLVVSAFLGGSWIAILGHYNFLKFRYMFSHITRSVVDAVLLMIDSKITAVPFIANYYFMLRRWLALPQR